MAKSDDQNYQKKFARIAAQTSYRLLPEQQQAFLHQQAVRHRFTLQELRQVTEIALELEMWNEASLQDLWPSDDARPGTTPREMKKRRLNQVRERWETLRASAQAVVTTKLSLRF